MLMVGLVLKLFMELLEQKVIQVDRVDKVDRAVSYTHLTLPTKA